MTAPAPQRCYRHPTVETYGRCTRCERPICPDCMLPATVGHQCPECVQEGRKQQRVLRPTPSTSYVTFAVIGLCVVLTAVAGGGSDDFALYRYGASFGPAVKAGEWWRLVTPMFLHAGIFHLAFNMFALYAYGPGLERSLGPVRFAGLFLVSGFAGVALSLRVEPLQRSVGASGAVFGILGAWAIYFYRRRANVYADQMFRGIAAIIGINLLFGFVIPNIDNWGHIGGLVGGAAIGFASDDGIGHRSRTATALWTYGAMAGVAAVGAVLVVTALSGVPACRLVERGIGLICR